MAGGTFRNAATIFDQALRDQSASEPDEDQLPAELRRRSVASPAPEARGTIVIDTPHSCLYYVPGGGREGFTWSDVQEVSREGEWPDWVPPAEMIKKQQYLPRRVAGRPDSPPGARPMYLGDTQFRIHGTNDPITIGTKVSSGCVRLTNEDVIDLDGRTALGAKAVVLPDASRRLRDEDAARSKDRRMASRQVPQPGPVASASGSY